MVFPSVILGDFEIAIKRCIVVVHLSIIYLKKKQNVQLCIGSNRCGKVSFNGQLFYSKKIEKLLTGALTFVHIH